MVDNRFKKKELNNQGVTLVELLVAVAIIGIIVGPFLHAFVSSIQTNSKARNSLRATTVAQDIVEGIKAYEIEELGYQFNFPDKGFHVIHNGSVSGGSVEEVLYSYSGGAYTSANPSIMPVNPLTDPHASVYSGDGGNTYTFLGQNSGIYYFTMSNLSFENKKYDALITLSANAYKAGGTSTVRPNDEQVVTIDKMDNFKDAYYVQEKGMDAKVLSEMIDSVSPNSVLQADVERTITITISNTVVPGKPDHTKASVSYNYIGTITGDPTLPPATYTSGDMTIFNNKISGEPLTHIYLFYYPLYNNWKSDSIIIKNNDNVPVVIHLVKQIDWTLFVAGLENIYKMNLFVEENTSDITKAVTSFQTNLNVNLDNQLPVLTQANVRFNGMNCNLSDFVTHGVVKKEKEDRLFDIYVDVYQEGSAIAGFPLDKKLVSFDSSKQD